MDLFYPDKTKTFEHSKIKVMPFNDDILKNSTAQKMLTTLLLSIYVIIPTLLGRAAHKKENSWKYANPFWQGFTKSDYIGHALLVALFSQGVYVFITSKPSLLIIAIQFLALTLAIYLDEKSRAFVTKNIKPIAWIASLIGLTFSYSASLYVDGTITSITAVKAAEFPAAQALLKLLVIVIFTLIFISFFFVIILALYSTKSFLESRRERSTYIINMKKADKSYYYPPIFSASNFTSDVMIIANSALLTIYFFPMYQIKPIFEGFKEISAEIIATTFKVRGESCGIDPKKNIKVAILSDKLFIRAFKNEEGKYQFIVDECVRNKKFAPNQQDQFSENDRSRAVEQATKEER